MCRRPSRALLTKYHSRDNREEAMSDNQKPHPDLAKVDTKARELAKAMFAAVSGSAGLPYGDYLGAVRVFS